VALRIKIKLLFTVTLFQHDLYIYIYIYIYSAMVSPSTFQSLSCFATYLPLDEFRVWFNFIYLFYLCGEDNGNAEAGYAFIKLMTDLLL
jgi:hypothetical protein